uniref:Uncharacterized protein n=1 Tax=Oryza sativa subsp. japonica TaxID=39947 RepID=Q69XT2_ORYSJ|nr:hypothetical protein [Oryza sativa Japonica Group]
MASYGVTFANLTAFPTATLFSFSAFDFIADDSGQLQQFSPSIVGFVQAISFASGTEFRFGDLDFTANKVDILRPRLIVLHHWPRLLRCLSALLTSPSLLASECSTMYCITHQEHERSSPDLYMIVAVNNRILHQIWRRSKRIWCGIELISKSDYTSAEYRIGCKPDRRLT